jgi:phosphonoacetaldehyde hydrolase
MAVKGTVRFNKQSLNKYRGIIFDLSGVLIDFGIHVPVIATSRVFNYHGIYIPEKHIRQNIGINGTNLENHIKQLCHQNNCKRKFDSIYTDYQNELVILNSSSEFTSPINGAAKTTNLLRQLGYKIGITTFYNKNVFSVIEKSLKLNDIVYDNVICHNEVILGKPEPYMLYKMINKLNLPAGKCIKVGESHLNMIEGLNAKMDTINVIDSSNLMGMDEQIFDDSCEAIKNIKRMETINKLINYPMPKYFISTVGDIGNILEKKI